MNKSAHFQNLDTFQIIRVSGTDSEKFLQGQLTCDVTDANGTQAVLGGYCNIKGRLHATFHLLKVGNDYLLITPEGVADHLIETLSKYAVFFDANLSIASALTLLAYENETSKDDYQQSHDKEYCLAQFQLGALEISIIEEAQLEKFQAKYLTDYQASEYDLFAIQHIELGIPIVTADTIEAFLPHHIGLAQIGGVNFKKGCYTGQEIVARMEYRGTLKTHAQKALIQSEAPIKAGAIIENSDARKVGEIVNTATNQQQQIALTSLADKALEQELNVNGFPLTLSK